MSKYRDHKKYEDYEFEDFLSDEFFVQWVKSPDENNSHFWEKWLTSNPKKRDLVSEAASFVRSIHYKENFEFSDEDYIDVFENILKAEVGIDSCNSIKPNEMKWYSIFSIRGVAASLLVLFCLWAQYEAFNFKTDPEPIPEIVLVKRSNPAGQKSIINLPDGSTIHLNANSEIEFPREFSNDIRLVSLTGEAFFEIEKENRPFIVQSGETKIQVLGTSFNVKKMGNESLYVALITGKVSVDTQDGSQMTLEPNEMLVIEEGGRFQKTGFDPKEVIGWKDNYLVFKTSSLPEIRLKLEQWYGVKIELKGDFDEKWTYSGIYKDEMLENVLRGICMTSGMNYKINKKQITLTNPK
jgi:ferric-dicitrate binding protein FerR (iron transport regulator)